MGIRGREERKQEQNKGETERKTAQYAVAGGVSCSCEERVNHAEREEEIEKGTSTSRQMVWQREGEKMTAG